MRVLLMLVLVFVIAISGCPSSDDGGEQPMERQDSTEDVFDGE
jgi:hypothetical protein